MVVLQLRWTVRVSASCQICRLRIRAIRLGDHRAFAGEAGSGAFSTIASVPYFLIGVSQAGWAWVVQKVPFLEDLFARRAPFRQVPLDDDAEVLATYEDE